MILLWTQGPNNTTLKTNRNSCIKGTVEINIKVVKTGINIKLKTEITTLKTEGRKMPPYLQTRD